MIAEVRIWDIVVGYLIDNKAQRYADFRFEKEFLKHNLDLSPLRLPMSKIDPEILYSFAPRNKADAETYKGVPDRKSVV